MKMHQLLLGLSLLLVALIWQLRRVGQRPKDYPPGPPTLPVIGNLHQIPGERRHQQFLAWAEEYGPIYSLITGNKTIIVLNSDVAIKDLLDKRGAIYSSRPDSYIAQTILSRGMRVLFMENTPNGVWSGVRKMLHLILNITAARTYVPYQDLENKAMLLGMLEDPSDFINHLRRYAASLTTQMTFGFRTTSMEDERIKRAYDLFDRSGQMIVSPMAGLLDLFPILRKLPSLLLPIKKEGQEMHRRELKLFKEYYNGVKQGLQNGTAKPSISVDIVKMQKQESLSDGLAAYIAGQILQAGSETTAGIVVGFIQAMVIFPEVAKMAQEELDRVCGRDRLPDLNDVPHLPYIRACAKECFRWMPGLLLGVPHAVTKEDSYMGYRIPKGATVIMNVWAVHNDAKRHPDPRKFDPMRYINDNSSSMDSANHADATKRDHFGFGAGRRRCQGMHIADRSVFLALSRLLWAFDFKRAKDPLTGKEIVPDMDELVDGILSMPKPFKCEIVPRDEYKARRVREEWDEVKKLLDEEMQWKEVPKGMVWGDETPQIADD
ncbi:cytochrome P450 [Nemania serpens]|nr:cytochrome P450 [Nemania serpens]